MGFSRQEYRSGLPFPSIGELSDPRIKPMSLMSPALAGGFFTTSTTSEAPKNAEHKRIDAFKLWCWKRLLRVPWTERKSSPLILKEINPEYSLEEQMLKRKLQYFDHLMQRADSLEKTLMLGKIEGKRRRGQQRMRWLDSITESMHMNVSKLQEIV